MGYLLCDLVRKSGLQWFCKVMNYGTLLCRVNMTVRPKGKKKVFGWGFMPKKIRVGRSGFFKDVYV